MRKSRKLRGRRTKNLIKSRLPRRLRKRRRKLQRKILPRRILLLRKMPKKQRRKRKKNLPKRLKRLQMPRPKLQTLKSANPVLKRRALKRSARSLVESKIQNGGSSIFGAQFIICDLREIFRNYVFLCLIKVVQIYIYIF